MIVNFDINEKLAATMNKVIEEWGFASRAELFRFLLMQFADTHGMTENQKTDYLVKEIEKEVMKKYKNKKIPSAHEQLSDIL